MILDVKEGGDARALIDAVVAKQDTLHRGVIQVSTVSGSYRGKVVERIGGYWVVLKADYESYMAEGTQKGESIYTYHYVLLSSIIAVSFEMVEKKEGGE